MNTVDTVALSFADMEPVQSARAATIATAATVTTNSSAMRKTKAQKIDARIITAIGTANEATGVTVDIER